MIANPDGNLHVYMVNIGQGDTTVIVSPAGNVMVMDVVNGTKVGTLLADLGIDGTVEHLVISHPHYDHYSGANRLVIDHTILQATLAPFWHEAGMGPATYRKLIGRLAGQGVNATFLSGYTRWYPDGSTLPATGNATPDLDPNAVFIDLLGASTGMILNLQDAGEYNPNHLSIMARIMWRQSFKMIIAADAQMENWAAFDEARLLEDNCHVLRSAHHGSANGTQWERIDRLDPSDVIVSSEPTGGHHLPDLPGSAILAKFDTKAGQRAMITEDTGTIHLTVTPSGSRSYERFSDAKTANVALAAGTPINDSTHPHPTDWPALLDQRVAEL